MIRFCIAALLLVAGSVAPAFAQSPEALSASDASPLPPDFRGKVEYFGNHTGRVATAHTFREGPFKDCIRPSKDCPAQLGGSLKVVLEFDGEIVHGVFEGTGGIRSSSLIGRRVGGQCELYDPEDGSTWSGICDRRNFNGRVYSVPNALVQVKLDFKTVGIRVVDASALYDQWLAEVRWVRAYDMAIRKWNSPYIDDRLRAAIELSAYGYQIDPFAPGSMGPISEADGEKRTRYLTIEYKTQSGARGWARATAEGRGHNREKYELVCIEFWDVSGCTPFNPPPRPPEPPRQPPQPDLSLGDDGSNSRK
jgi:hypothetical protein